MKMIYQLLSQFFNPDQKQDIVPSEERNFFDFSSSEKIKILRAAGRAAQKEQQQLLKSYEARFGRTS